MLERASSFQPSARDARQHDSQYKKDDGAGNLADASIVQERNQPVVAASSAASTIRLPYRIA